MPRSRPRLRVSPSGLELHERTYPYADLLAPRTDWEVRDQHSASAAETGVAYNLYIDCDDQRIAVWWGPVSGEMRIVLEMDNAELLTTEGFGMGPAEGFRFDNFRLGRGNLGADYRYDAFGRRIERILHGSEGPEVTRFAYAGSRVIEETNDTGGALATYVYGNYIDEVITIRRRDDTASAFAVYYLHPDAQCNTMAITDANGAVVETYDYADYGQPTLYAPDGSTRNVSAIGNRILFTGRPYDTETGYYYFRARYLDPTHGRFTSRDPLGPWGDPLNLGNAFTYAASNPWSLTDPFGLAAGGNVGPTRWRGMCNPVDIAWMFEGALWEMPKEAITGTIYLVFHIPETAEGMWALGGMLYTDFSGTAGLLWDKASFNFGNIWLNPQSTGKFLGEIGTIPLAAAKLGRAKLLTKVDDVAGSSRVIRMRPALADAGGGDDLTSAFMAWLNKGPKNVAVYEGRVRGNVGPMPDYFGVSNNVARRAREHGSRFVVRGKPGLNDFTVNQGRAIEQFKIDEVGLDKLQNIRNSIARKNRFYQMARQWAENHLKQRNP